MIEPGRYRFVAATSRASIVAHALGHRFTADGAGLDGTLHLEKDRILFASVVFPLTSFDAHDFLKNRELRKFFSATPKAKGEIRAPIAVAGGRGRGRIAVDVRGHTMEVDAELWEGDGPGPSREVHARFQLTFTGLGYEVPKVLFLKVKDLIDVEVTGTLEEADAAG